MIDTSDPLHCAAARTPLRSIGILLLTTLLLFGCKSATPAGPTPPDTTKPKKTHVLFIGNSLTYSNHLPLMLQGLAAAAGVDTLTVQMIAYGGFGLLDHWPRSESHTAIATKTWNVVVLQQGMSGYPEGRASLIEYARRYNKEIRAAGAVPALYSVWPPSDADDYENYFNLITESYSLAAEEVDGMLFPVGEAWRAAWRRDSTLKFYSSDNLHPTEAGTYLAALVMFQQLYDRSPIGLPSTFTLLPPLGFTITIPPDDARVMQDAAAEANTRYRRR